MGKHSNIIFCDGTKIVDSIKHVGAAVSSVREVLPGRDYFIPNTTGKTNPLAADKTFFSSLFSSGKILLPYFQEILPESAMSVQRKLSIAAA